MTDTRVYKIWQNMLDRCKNSNTPGYKNYGGRGIVVCERWLKFDNFYADMGNPPKDLTLERVNNNGNYEPFNCKWATHREQTNNARSNIIIEYDNQKLNLSQWAEKTGIKYTTLYRRIKSNWTIQKALTMEVRQWPSIS